MARLRIVTTIAIFAGLTSSSTPFAQCEVHETAKPTASDAVPIDLFGWSVNVSDGAPSMGICGDD